MKRSVFAVLAGLALFMSNAMAQTGTWQFQVTSPVVGAIGTIRMPGKLYSAGMPLKSPTDRAVVVTSAFIEAMAKGDLTTASAWVCPNDRGAFAAMTKDEATSYGDQYPTRQAVALIEYPAIEVVFVKLIGKGGAILRAIQLLPPATQTGPIVRGAQSISINPCITQLDDAVAALRDLYAETMFDLKDPSFPNPYPNGIP